MGEKRLVIGFFFYFDLEYCFGNVCFINFFFVVWSFLVVFRFFELDIFRVWNLSFFRFGYIVFFILIFVFFNSLSIFYLG